MPEELNDTQPNAAMGDTQPNSIAPKKDPTRTVKKFPRWLVTLVVAVLIVAGLLAGYGSGMGQRYAVQNTVESGQLQEQYQLGQQAVADGNYEIAQKYFEFIIRTDSNFPGIQAAYTDLLLRMHVSPTPAFSPTPIISPTPDLRGIQVIFDAAQAALNASDWDGTISNLDSLRKTDPTYRTAEVDGMYFMALRQRGVGKITAACQDTNLEGGIYDLTLAEHFIGDGNLDSVAQSLRTYARLYIIGASFWDQDWVQAQSFFAQVMTGYPNMSDSSCLSATKRWYQATINYAEQLLSAGDPCGAEEQYASALTVDNPFNPTVFPTATAVNDQCNGGGGNNNPGPGNLPAETPTATETPTITPTP